MTEETYPPILQAMIDRAGTLTEDETRQLGELWESEENLVLPTPSVFLELVGFDDYPVITNMHLIDAWQRALDVAGKAGRVTELDAARAAGRATDRDERHNHDTEAEKNGTEQAVRAAVLAVGVHDLLEKKDYVTLVAPWQHILGTTLIEHVHHDQ